MDIDRLSLSINYPNGILWSLWGIRAHVLHCSAKKDVSLKMELTLGRFCGDKRIDGLIE